MRSVPAGSFERLSSLDALWAAWRDYRRGKRRLARVARSDLEADDHLLALHRQLRAGTYRPGTVSVRVIRDPKTRLITAAPIRDRVVQRALVDALDTHYTRSFIHHSYAGGTGRGPHRAVLQHLGWMRTRRFRLGLDIARCFASVRHDILAGLIHRRLRAARTRALWDAQVAVGGAVYQTPAARRILGEVPPGQGLALGSWLSQWAADLYLDGLDHFIKRELKIGAYLRFMDDFTLFSDDRTVLEAARPRIAEWLAAERGMALNPHRIQLYPTSTPCTWLGYRCSRSGLSPGKKMRRRMPHRIRRAAAEGPEVLERCLRAYAGLVTFG